MRFALVGLCLLVSCGDDDARQTLHEHRTVTTPGGTCGRWQETTSDPATITYVSADCDAGLFCAGTAYALARPEQTTGRDFYTCLPITALGCANSQSSQCIAPFSCQAGLTLPPEGVCIHTCTNNVDCPDTYQICDSDWCVVLPCGVPVGAGYTQCPAGTHCQDSICRPDQG